MGAAGVPAAVRGEIGLDDLRRRVLRLGIAACVVGGFLLMFPFSRSGETAPWLVAAMLSAYTLAGVTYVASRASTRLGGLVLAVGLLLLAIGALWINSLAWLIHLVPVLVLFTGTFLGLREGCATAAIVSAALLLTRSLGGPIATDQLLALLPQAWANVLLAWLATEPVRLALEWSWSHYVRAERETTRAREQQGQLASVVKSLSVAQDRLEQMNGELERARAAAEEARRLKAEFAATISHELRTPLNLIVGFSEMLAAGGDDALGPGLSPACQRDVDTIYRNARHLSTLIDDILDLAQIDAARMGLVRERASLRDVALEAAAAVQSHFGRKGLSVAVDVPADLPRPLVDRARVRQILINLLGNASRFTDTGGVRIGARQDGQDVVVAVSDTGVGLSPEDLPRVFEEFRQGIGPAARRAGGSGLGLTISKRFAEMHGGAMWVESRRGEGSTFYFTLPLHEQVASATIRREWETWARPAGSDGREEFVVAVGGDEPSVRLLQRHLAGYRVVAVGDAAAVQALRRQASIRAIAVLGSEAWERASAVRAEARDLPVVFCSLHGPREALLELGGADYLVKPVLQDQLAPVLRRGGRFVEEVLVVDDDPDMADLLTRMTRAIAPEARVRAAYGGAEGLAAMRERRPDIALLDLLMPGVDGYAVLRAMRADPGLRAVAAVIVTAQSGQDEALSAGVVGVTRGEELTGVEAIRLLKASVDALGGERGVSRGSR